MDRRSIAWVICWVVAPVGWLVGASQTVWGQCPNPTKIGSDVALTDSTRSAGEPDAVWNGSEFGVAWGEGNDVWFARIDIDGNVLDARKVNDGDGIVLGHRWPTLAWNGSGWGISWTRRIGTLNQYEIVFARLSAAGVKLATEAVVSTNRGVESSLVWNGDGYALVYRLDGSTAIYLVRLDAPGNVLGETSVGSGYHPVLAWAGSHYGVGAYEILYPDFVWGVGFWLLDADGSTLNYQRVDTDATRNSQTNGELDVAWSGSEFGVAWNGAGSYSESIWFRRVDAGGNPSGTPRGVSNTYSGTSLVPKIAWDGGGWGVVWYDYWYSQFEIFYQGLDATGNPVGGNSRLTNDAAASTYATLARSGDGYGVFWIDDRQHPGSTTDLFYLRLRCCSDADSDGHSVCAGDCDDTDPFVYPGALETCDGVNNDCDDPSWPALPGAETDDDGDSWTECDGDCDDGRGDVHPGHAEVCDTVDNDCNGSTDEGLDVDADADGWNAASSCHGPFDCDDADSAVTSGNTCVSQDPVEVSDGLVDLTFPNVTSGGTTTIVQGPCDESRLDGIVTSSGCTDCVEVQTDAEWDGDVLLCLHYDDSCMTPTEEENMVMATCDAGTPPRCEALTGVTRDTAANVICGYTSHFSYFAVGQRLDSDGDLVWDLVDNCPHVWNLTQSNQDLDAAGNACDCDSNDPGVWSAPDPVRNLSLTRDPATGIATLSWMEPVDPGGVSPAYDTIRSTSAIDFVIDATCTEWDDPSDRTATEAGVPAPGEVFHFLVRAETTCGAGALAPMSDGARVARSCP